MPWTQKPEIYKSCFCFIYRSMSFCNRLRFETLVAKDWAVRFFVSVPRTSLYFAFSSRVLTPVTFTPAPAFRISSKNSSL